MYVRSVHCFKTCSFKRYAETTGVRWQKGLDKTTPATYFIMQGMAYDASSCRLAYDASSCRLAYDASSCRLAYVTSSCRLAYDASSCRLVPCLQFCSSFASAMAVSPGARARPAARTRRRCYSD